MRNSKPTKTVRQGSVTFTITENGILKNICNEGSKNISFKIPRVLLSGDVINVLGRKFAAYEEFDELIISDDIHRVEESAFASSWVKSVKWSSRCRIIPPHCFDHSHIEKINNIENVKRIGHHAFYWSDIKEIAWPDQCIIIPENCFEGCKLSITGLEKVETISNLAFKWAKFIDSTDFSNVKFIADNAFENADTNMADFLSKKII